jgi:hypothetical protein
MQYMNTRRLARTLLALAAGATLATTAQATPIYFTFKGTTVAGPRTIYGTNGSGGSLGGGSLGSLQANAGAAFSFTLGLDNGGSSALSQSWTAADVRSMRFELPTSSGTTWYAQLNFGGATGIPLKYLNANGGGFATDANGLVSSVFSSLGFAPNRTLRGFVPTTDQLQTNGQPITALFDFGLFDLPGYGTSEQFVRLVANYTQGTNAMESGGAVTAQGWGAGAGLTDASKWNPSTATGAPLAAAVPEPEAWALMVGGLMVVGASARNARRASASR